MIGCNFFDHRLAIGAEGRFFDLHVENLAHELGVQADFERVQQPAFEDHGKFLRVGGIDHFAADRREIADREFIDRAAGNQSAIVGHFDLLGGRHRDRKSLPFD